MKKKAEKLNLLTIATIKRRLRRKRSYSSRILLSSSNWWKLSFRSYWPGQFSFPAVDFSPDNSNIFFTACRRWEERKHFFLLRSQRHQEVVKKWSSHNSRNTPALHLEKRSEKQEKQLIDHRNFWHDHMKHETLTRMQSQQQQPHSLTIPSFIPPNTQQHRLIVNFIF